MELALSSMVLAFACSLSPSPPTVVTEDQLGAAVCLALLKGPGLCCGHNWELLGMLGIRPHLVVSHHGRKGLVSLVYYKARYIIINVILL